LDNATGTVIEKCFIQGQNSAGEFSTFKLEQGIKITGMGDPVVYSIKDTQVYFAENGLQVTNTNAEGVYVNGCTFVNVNIGVDWNTSTPQIELEWSQSHIASRKVGFRLTNLSQFSITNSMFQLQSGLGGTYFNWDCVQANITDAVLFGNMSNCVIQADNFVNPSTGLPIVTRGVVVVTGGGFKTSNNWFFNLDAGVVYSSASSSCWSFGDQFIACDVNVSDPSDVNYGQHTTSGTLSIGTKQSGNTFELKGSFSRGVPVSKTVDFTLGATENFVFVDKGSTCNVTLPTPATSVGREVTFITRNAQSVVASLSTIILRTGSSTTTILPATAGAWVTLVCDGASWLVVAGS
jgi:hypothetical protein